MGPTHSVHITCHTFYHMSTPHVLSRATHILSHVTHPITSHTSHIPILHTTHKLHTHVTPTLHTHIHHFFTAKTHLTGSLASKESDLSTVRWCFCCKNSTSSVNGTCFSKTLLLSKMRNFTYVHVNMKKKTCSCGSICRARQQRIPESFRCFGCPLLPWTTSGCPNSLLI